MKYIKLYNNHSDYLKFTEEKEDNSLPYVSFCKNNSDLHYDSVKEDETRIIAKFSVTGPTVLIISDYATISTFSLIEVNGVIQDVITKDYTITDEEELIVKYTYDGSTISGEFDFLPDLISLEIPKGITQISSILGVSNLEYIKLSNTIETIDNNVCINSAIKNLVVPSSITSFGSKTFYDLDTIKVNLNNPKYNSRNNCNAVISDTNVLIKGSNNTIIPEDVVSIETYAFYKCSSIQLIIIPPLVTSIKSNAFDKCTSLSSIILVSETPPTLGSNVFRDNDVNRKIYVPEEYVNTYKQAWLVYADNIEAISLNSNE